MATLQTIPADEAALLAKPETKATGGNKKIVAGAAMASFVLGLLAATVVTSQASRAPAALSSKQCPQGGSTGYSLWCPAQDQCVRPWEVDFKADCEKKKTSSCWIDIYDEYHGCDSKHQCSGAPNWKCEKKPKPSKTCWADNCVEINQAPGVASMATRREILIFTQADKDQNWHGCDAKHRCKPDGGDSGTGRCVSASSFTQGCWSSTDGKTHGCDVGLECVLPDGYCAPKPKKDKCARKCKNTYDDCATLDKDCPWASQCDTEKGLCKHYYENCSHDWDCDRSKYKCGPKGYCVGK